MMNLIGSSRNRPTASRNRPHRPPAALRSFWISSRAACTALPALSISSLSNESLVASALAWRSSSFLPNAFSCSAAHAASSAGSSVANTAEICLRASLMISSAILMMPLT